MKPDPEQGAIDLHSFEAVRPPEAEPQWPEPGDETRLSFSCTVDLTGRVLAVNGSSAAHLGYQTETLLQTSMFDLFDPAERSRLKATLIALGQNPDRVRQEHFHLLKQDGNRKRVQVVAQVLQSIEGTVVLLNCQERCSTTESQPPEAAPTSSDPAARSLDLQQFQIMADILPIFIAYVDTEQRYYFTNRMYELQFGLSREEAYGKTVREVIGEEFYSRARAQIERVLTGEPVNYEFVIPGYADADRYLDVHLLPDWNEQAQLRGYCVLMRDITDRKRTESELHSVNIALENAVEGISRLDTQGYYLSVNDAYARLCGYEPGQMVGMNWQRTVHPEDLPMLQAAFQDMRNTGRVEVETRGVRQDGSIFYKQVTMINAYSTQGVLNGHYCFAKDISERKRSEANRKQAEADLQAANNRLDFLLNGSPVVIFSCRPGGDFGATFVSKNITPICGYRPEEFVENSEFWLNHVHPDDREQFLSGLPDLFLTNSFSVEYRLRHADDTYRCMLEQLRLIRDEAGQPLEVLGYLIDISDRKQTEEALRQSEAQLKEAQRIAHLGSWEIDVATKEITYSEELCRILGRQTHSESIEQAIEVVHPADRRRVKAMVLSALVRIPADSVEYRVVHSDGSIRYVISNIAVVKDTQSQSVKLFGTALDITERKQVELALQERNYMLRTIGDNLPKGLVYQSVYDPQRRRFYFTHMSAGIESIVGLKAEAVLQDPNLLQDLIVEADRQRFKQLIEAAGRTLTTFKIQFRKYRLDGSIQWSQVLAAPRQSKDGHIIWDGIEIDITDLKQTEAELQQAKEAAEAASHAKTAFLSRMSHELRTPLTAILGFAELLANTSSLSQEHQEHLAIISRSGTHLLNLINDVLEMSKIEAGEIGLNETSVDLYYLLENIEKLLQLKAATKGLELVFTQADGLPQYIQADESKLRQVLINLLGNAIKFTDVGRVTLRVSSGSQQQGNAATLHPSACNTLRFEVEDTGPGIAPREVGNLFDAFSQTKTGRYQGGAGLGLAISRQFVQLMGGDITVQSEVGRGTTFTFEIQLNPSEANRTQQATSAHGKVIGLAAEQSTYRILIVDDDPLTPKILARLLAPLGFEVREVTDGQAAIELWERWQPHLIWMDMQMPLLDGYEATRRIRMQEKNRWKASRHGSRTPSLAFPFPWTKIIALTANAFEEQRASVLAAGCDDFVTKPFQKAVILQKIAEHLGVGYAYEAQAGNLPSAGIAAISPPKPSDLSIMPVEWSAALRLAATALNLDQCLQLIEQIPEEQAPLARVLRELVNNFRFDTLLDLLQ